MMKRVDRDVMIIQLREDGLTYDQIAARVGGISPGGVNGVIRRVAPELLGKGRQRRRADGSGEQAEEPFFLERGVPRAPNFDFGGGFTNARVNDRCGRQPSRPATHVPTEASAAGW